MTDEYIRLLLLHSALIALLLQKWIEMSISISLQRTPTAYRRRGIQA